MGQSANEEKNLNKILYAHRIKDKEIIKIHTSIIENIGLIPILVSDSKSGLDTVVADQKYMRAAILSRTLPNEEVIEFLRGLEEKKIDLSTFVCAHNGSGVRSINEILSYSNFMGFYKCSSHALHSPEMCNILGIPYKPTELHESNPEDDSTSL